MTEEDWEVEEEIRKVRREKEREREEKARQDM